MTPRRATASLLITFFLLAGGFFAVITVVPMNVRATTLYVGGVGPGNYTKIQDALNASSPGDTVFVYSGTYHESIGVNHVSLVGENRDTTIIDAGGAWVAVYMGSWANISGFTITNGNFTGIEVYWSSNCRIADNIISNAGNGIYFNASTGITISNNKFVNNGISLDSPYNDQVRYWNSHAIDSLNTVNGRPLYFWKDRNGGSVPSDAGAIILANTTGIVAANQNINGGYAGIDVAFSSQVTISDSNVTSTSEQGIYVAFSNNITVTRNNISGSKEGILFHLTRDDRVANNNISSNRGDGLHMRYTQNDVIENNNVWSNSWDGIDAESSSRLTIVNNTLSSNGGGIYHSSGSSTVSGNIVTGNDVGIRVIGNGNVIDNNTVRYNMRQGIEVDTWDNIVTRNLVSNSQEGIRLYDAHRNTIAWNNASRNNCGICLGTMDEENLVSNNSLWKNKYGIIVYMFTADTIVSNNVSSNDYGIYVSYTDKTKVYHNNIVGNFAQSYDDTGSQWDDGYPSGGNYWSDYTGKDNCSGPNQNICPDPDGIGDTPRQISTNSAARDHYPLMRPFTPLPSPPSEPWGLQAAGGDTQVSLTWNAPALDGGSPVTNYTIYRGTISGGEAFLVEVGNILSYDDTGLSNGQTYYYKVSAKNAIGEGPRSSEASATPATSPGPPTGFAAVGGDSKVTLTWSPPLDNGGSPVTNYRIYKGTASGGETFYVEVGNVATYTVLGLINGQTYYFEVSAKNVAGEGQRSDEEIATPKAAPTVPGRPTGLAAVAGDGQVTLTWAPPSDDGGSPITNYEVYRGTAPGGESFLVQLGYVLSYVDNSVTNGQTYYYKIGAMNIVGEGQLSNEANATPSSGLNPPSEPLNLQAIPEDQQVTLRWIVPASDGGTPITRYVVYRGTTSGGESFLAEIGNVLMHIDAGLSNEQIYFYKVSAKNAVGEGAQSSEASATPTSGIGAPSAPQNLQASAGDARITLTWSPPSSDGGSPITNYKIYRGTVSGGESLLVETTNVPSYIDAGLTNGQTYFYDVSAVNLAGEGPRSNEASATPVALPPVNLPPTCNIISPIPGSMVAGTYRIAGIASDVDGTVQKVEVKIDNGRWIEASGNTSWTYDWDTTAVPNGQHTIYARSYDGTNNSVEVSVTVTVSNAPQPPPQETSAYQWAFWTLLAVAIVETALLLFLLLKGRKGKESQEEQSTEPVGGEGAK